jgi:hypothetical protein
MPDITAANAVFIISVPAILPVPQRLQGFAADDIFDVEDVDATDMMMGVDGVLSAGMVFAPHPMNVALQADSASISFFDAWYQAQQGNQAAYPAVATITFPSIGISYLLNVGFLSRYKSMADAKKVLQPRKFRITWQNISPAPVGSSG